MSFYNQLENVQNYINMCDDRLAKILVEILNKHLKKDKSLLEIGMGPGFDLNVLSKSYKVTGSDFSDQFLNLYRKKYPEADLLNLNAITLDTNRSFDCLYSNKVLIHLKKEELIESVKRQSKLLNKDGLIFHTFWKGRGEDISQGLFTQYYLQENLLEIFNKEFDLIDIHTYKEFEEEDSILLIMKVKS